MGSATSSTFSSEVSFEYHEHNAWNFMLDALFHFEVGVVLEALLDEVAMPDVNDHVSVRNWPPPPCRLVATESANLISLAAANEPTLMQYVLDGSTWSFICPFLDLFDATTWNSAAKYLGGALLFFLLHNALGHA